MAIKQLYHVKRMWIAQDSQVCALMSACWKAHANVKYTVLVQMVDYDICLCWSVWHWIACSVKVGLKVDRTQILRFSSWLLIALMVCNKTVFIYSFSALGDNQRGRWDPKLLLAREQPMWYLLATSVKHGTTWSYEDTMFSNLICLSIIITAV